MKLSFAKLIDSSLWHPATALMHNLHFGPKLAIISSVLMLPTIGLLATHMQSAMAGAEPGGLVPAAALFCLALAGYLLVGFYRSTMAGHQILRRHMFHMSMGDLAFNIDFAGKNEMSDLLRELKNMQQSLGQTVKHVQEVSDHILHSSSEIAQGTQDLSARTEAAAAALEQSAAALQETISTSALAADSVRQASRIALDNASTASHGGVVMLDVEHTMERIHDASRKIGDIIGVIDGIAFQTNILALNAAVEAARAGAQGRGFAVVASEVRALAGRSAAAAREIKCLISSSNSEVASGAGIVRQAGATMKQIVGNADKIKHLLDDVAHGASEQTQGICEIGKAVRELDRHTQSNAALVEEMTAAAGTQRGVVVRLDAQVGVFKISGGTKHAVLVDGVDVDACIDGHRQWKVKLRDAIAHDQKVDVKTLVRDDCCMLGKWIHGDGRRLGQRAAFSELVGKHAHFHRVAGQVGELINQGRHQQAEDAMGHGTPFAQATDDVVFLLSNAKRQGFH